MELKFYKLGSVPEKLFTRAVVVCKYKGKWVFSKHRERGTWEIPGGHIENGEDWKTAAKREIFEETGATEIEIIPVAIYSISTYAILCYGEIKKFGHLPNSEMEKIGFFDTLPTNLTYVDGHTKMFNLVNEYLTSKNNNY